MSDAKTLSIVMPFRNRPLPPFEVALKSLEMQTQQPDEVIIVDIASTEDYSNQMRGLCEEYSVSYTHIDLDLPDKAIDVYLWNTCFNHGVRKATGDLVMYSALDRVYEENMVGCLLDYYNFVVDRWGDAYFASKVYNLYRTPDLEELFNFDTLIAEAEWRGGYGYWGTSREWIHKVKGLDESIRWYEDLDLTRRAKLDGLSVIWVSHGRIQKHIGKISRVLHLANHPVGRRKYGGRDVTAIATRGKLGLSQNSEIVRNDETWGLITKEKIRNALEKVRVE